MEILIYVRIIVAISRKPPMIKLYKDYRTTTKVVPKLNRRDPLTNQVIEVYSNVEVKITDCSLSYREEPIFKFTLYISNESNLDFNGSFKFDYFVDGIHVELLKCRVDSTSAKRVELSCTSNCITGFDVTKDLLAQLVGLTI